MSCPECFSGHVHEGDPTGKTQTLHSLTTYSATPTGTPKGIIVIIPDAFGIEFVNNKLLADHYAAKGGYTVHLPDFMAGTSAPEQVLNSLHVMESSAGWFTKIQHVPYLIRTLIPFLWTNRFGSSYPRVKPFIQSLHAANPTTPIFVSGFCWGGKHVCLLSADPDTHPLITAGFTGHPSQLSIPEEIHTLHNPVSFALAENDGRLQKDARDAIEKAIEGKEGEVVTYEGVGHGFCIRADHTRDAAREAAEKAEDQCLAWFDRHLPRS